MRLLLLFLFFCPFLAYPQSISGELAGLATIQHNVKSKRISSFDRSGDNHDHLSGIKSGEKRTIFDVKGVGTINHIWITMSPGPEQLSRNDIIIRMYWDGNEYPSVESPIGPFFGQGWTESYVISRCHLQKEQELK